MTSMIRSKCNIMGTYSAPTVEIVDNDKKIKSVLALRTYWNNQYCTKA